jgi:2,3-bisphosphoglycerate-dependent phosphoglycerate mutase
MGHTILSNRVFIKEPLTPLQPVTNIDAMRRRRAGRQLQHGYRCLTLWAQYFFGKWHRTTQNIHHYTGIIQKNHVQRQRRVLHPHGGHTVAFGKLKQHPAIRGKIAAEHQTLTTLSLCLRHFNLKHHATAITANNGHGRFGEVLWWAVGVGTEEPPARHHQKSKPYQYFFSWHSAPHLTIRGLPRYDTLRMTHLVLVRHGLSTWNKENRFTGWADVPLTAEGENEAHQAGEALARAGITLEKGFVSPLLRARETARLLLEGYGAPALPLTPAPAMIERYYGGLTGLNKAEVAAQYGDDQVHVWRRSYDIPPPPIAEDSPYNPANVPAFANFPFPLPRTESLADVVARVKLFYEALLKPAVLNNNGVLCVAHGNSIRALLMLLKNISKADIPNLEIATGVPLVVRLSNKGDYTGETRINL